MTITDSEKISSAYFGQEFDSDADYFDAIDRELDSSSMDDWFSATEETTTQTLNTSAGPPSQKLFENLAGKVRLRRRDIIDIMYEELILSCLNGYDANANAIATSTTSSSPSVLSSRTLEHMEMSNLGFRFYEFPQFSIQQQQQQQQPCKEKMCLGPRRSITSAHIPVQVVENIADKYRRLDESQVLGQGGEGTVYKTARRADGKPFAHKVYHCPCPLGRENDLPNDVRILKELASVDADSCSPVCKAHDWWLDRQRCWNVTYDYFDFGDLGALNERAYAAINRAPFWPEPFLWHVLVSLTKSLAYLQHGWIPGAEAVPNPNWKCVLHRDIKPANILLGRQQPDQPYPSLHLADFGLAVVSDGSGSGKTDFDEYVGTFRFQPPECPVHSPTSEVWAIGATLHTLIWDRPPVAVRPSYYVGYRRRSRQTMRTLSHMSGEEECVPWNQMSSATKDLVWETDPESRRPILNLSGLYSSRLQFWLSRCLSKDLNLRITVMELVKNMLPEGEAEIRKSGFDMPLPSSWTQDPRFGSGSLAHSNYSSISTFWAHLSNLPFVNHLSP